MKLKLTESNLPKLGNLEYTSLVPTQTLNKLNTFFESCQKITDYVNQHSEILSYTDDKLHSLFYEFDDIDDMFLQVSWEDFEEYCKENDIEIDPIRSSSSKFYLNDEDSVITTIRKYADEYSCTYLDMVDALDELLLDVPYYISMNDLRTDEAFNDYLMNTVMDEYDTDGTIEDIQEAVTDICNSEPLIYSIEQEAYCSDYIIKKLESVVAAYEYVQSFKDNAVDYYKDWIENN